MPLYQNSVLKKYLKQQDKDAVAKAFKKFAKYFHDSKIQENIRSSKEEEYQGIFLTELGFKTVTPAIFGELLAINITSPISSIFLFRTGCNSLT